MPVIEHHTDIVQRLLCYVYKLDTEIHRKEYATKQAKEAHKTDAESTAKQQRCWWLNLTL